MQPATKPYDLTFMKRPDYLYARISAPLVSRGMAFDYLAEIADKCGAVRCRRLLIERDVPEMPTGYALAAINEFVRMSKNLRVAFVNRHASVGASLMQLIKTNAAQGSSVAYFDNIRDAEVWLIGN